MRGRVPVAASPLLWLTVTVGAHGCAVGISGTCAENGTCPVEAGAAPADADVGSEPVPSDGPSCDPKKDPSDEPCWIDEAYGVFVAPQAAGGDDTGGDGTRAHPYATIGAALQRLGGRARVYVCDGEYAEQVTLTVAASIYGGLACPGDDAGAPFAYVGGVARVVSPAADYAIKIEQVGAAIAIEDMAFTAPDAIGTGADGTGRSSIAALVDSSDVGWKRVSLVAGAGADGADGANGAGAPNYPQGTPAPGGSSGEAPGAGAGGGGAGGYNKCVDLDTSTGGAGGVAGAGTGNGSPPIGGDGQAGSAMPPPSTSAGLDGAGAPGGKMTCGPPGTPGAPGLARSGGGAAASYGALSGAGWQASGGGDGPAGAPGQGGGGGGGLTSVGGNGGGAGGCGGSGGSGGRGGGGSIALASVASTQILVQCTLATGSGGAGGAGGVGDVGQLGGAGTVGNGCPGGPGGAGAGGSGGAGGTGGISVGILYTGPSPAYDGRTTITVGDADARGSHGAGAAAVQSGSAPGHAGVDGDDGRPGVAQAVLAL